LDELSVKYEIRNRSILKFLSYKYIEITKLMDHILETFQIKINITEAVKNH